MYFCEYLKKIKFNRVALYVLFILLAMNLACSQKTTTRHDSIKKSPSSPDKTPSSSLFKPLNKKKKLGTDSEKFIVLGDELFLKGDFDSASIKYNLALKANPSSVDACIRLGDIYLRKGEYKKSGEFFKKAIDIEPENKFARFGYADILLEMGEKEDSEWQLRQVISFDPKFAQAYTSLGDIYLDSGKQNKAGEMFRKSLEIMPDQNFPDTYIGMGELNLARLKYQEALESFNTAKKKDPYDIDGYLGAARALTALKRYEDAKRNYKKALEIFPDHREACEMLVEFYKDRGMHDKAKKLRDKLPVPDLQP
ncbi:MAG: tetratricopeptide repeat protein [Candidatus Eremiobacteraeota bacterium]|nr:tetratricopeptide repeat protein [Candidatus Eremiobacteraeota bacterium]